MAKVVGFLLLVLGLPFLYLSARHFLAAYHLGSPMAWMAAGVGPIMFLIGVGFCGIGSVLIRKASRQ